VGFAPNVRRKSFHDFECCIARAVDEIGDPWTLLILRNALLGARKFSDFERALGIPSSTLTRRLNELMEKDLLTTVEYEEHPPRVEYALTERGQGLFPVLLILADWGAKWLSPDGPPLELIDACSGEKVKPRVIDANTGHLLELGEVALRPGAGASAELRALFCGRELVFGGAA